MKNAKIVILILSLLITTAIVAACSTENNNRPERTIQVPALPTSLDPPRATDQTSSEINAYIHSTLVNICDETSQPVPALAIMWDMSDDRTINMMLRQNAVFHNGDSLTAHDVAFSLTRVSAMQQSADILGMIGSVTVHNEHNFTIHLSGTSHAMFLSDLAHPNAAILPQAHILEVGDEIFAAQPIGAGAYIFDYMVESQRISLVKNAEYWGEMPYFERIIFEIASTE